MYTTTAIYCQAFRQNGFSTDCRSTPSQCTLVNILIYHLLVKNLHAQISQVKIPIMCIAAFYSLETHCIVL